jgi:hypothetical protein
LVTAAVPVGAVNPTYTALSLTTLKDMLVGGPGTVVTLWAFEAGDVPFALVALMLNEYVVLGDRPVRGMDVAG